MPPVRICIKLCPTKQTESSMNDDAVNDTASSPTRKSSSQTRSVHPDRETEHRKSPQDSRTTEDSVDGLSRIPSADVEELNPPLNLSGGLRGVRRSGHPHIGSSQTDTQIWKPYSAPASKRARANAETYIKIVEQPASNASRFRYECEGRTAGSIIGVRSTPDRKTFPAIKLVGYEGPGKPYVVVSCVTKDYPCKPHPHNLVGTDCIYGVCKADIENGRTKTFSNLGIQCVKKKDFEKALILRERNNIDPFKTGFSHKSDRSTIDLNAVRLCFQAFVPGQGAITPPVASDVIFDKKFVGVLTICKLSKYSASVEGGDEIILLCRKICKDDIKVYFYETQNEKVVWQAEAQLTPEQIHEQSAIAFLTPKYKNVDLQNPVQVFIQLFRPSDGAVSEPRPFHLYPINSLGFKLNFDRNQAKPTTGDLPQSIEILEAQLLANRQPQIFLSSNQPSNASTTTRISETSSHTNGQLQAMPQINRETQNLLQAQQQSCAVSYAIREPNTLPQPKPQVSNLPRNIRHAEPQLHTNPQPDVIPHSDQQYCILSYARQSDDVTNGNSLHLNLPNTTWQSEPLPTSNSQPDVVTHSTQKFHTLPFAIRQPEAEHLVKSNHWTVRQTNRQPEPLIQIHAQPEDIAHVGPHRLLWTGNIEEEPLPYNARDDSSLDANQQRWTLPYGIRHPGRLHYDDELIYSRVHPDEQDLRLMHTNPQPEDLSNANSQLRDLPYDRDVHRTEERLHSDHGRAWTLLPSVQNSGPPPAHSQSEPMYAVLETNDQRWTLPYASRQCDGFVRRINDNCLARAREDRQRRHVMHMNQQPHGHKITQRWVAPYVMR